jgi:hypothetical protein
MRATKEKVVLRLTDDAKPLDEPCDGRVPP